MRFARAILPSFLIMTPSFAFAQGAAGLMPHRAVYELTLDKASEQSGIADIAGRMVYEFNGSHCTGFTTSFRFVTEIDTNDATRITDQQTKTFESADGKRFDFETKSYVDRALDRELKGSASNENAKLDVKLDKPQENDVSLPAAQFPTQHMLDLLTRAQKGESFYETTLFDGSDEGDKLMSTSVVIGKPTKGTSKEAEAPALGAVSDQNYWPVEMAYFDLIGDGGEETPDYRTSFKLYANGLTRDLTMDYGDFSMRGRLVKLEMLDPQPASCDEAKPTSKP